MNPVNVFCGELLVIVLIFKCHVNW